jgi:Leucine-rich repeat (LRR) protein
MRWILKTNFDSVEEGSKSPIMCRKLYLSSIKKSFMDCGSSLAKLKNLRNLHIQGDVSIYYDYKFCLPREIGALFGLKKLTLLNLPLKFFPDWVFQLTKLEYLMIRGNDIEVIPGQISRFSQLRTLRIENCPLKSLPPELIELKNLKNLGLSDTELTAIDSKTLPPRLRKIGIAGTPLWEDEFFIKRLKISPY